MSAAEEKKVMAILEPSTPNDCGFTSATVRSLEGLLNDLCDAFLDFGAQYPFFTRCIRLFLANGFPAKIRSMAIQRLRGALHLLSLSDDGDLVKILPSFFAGGLPLIDGSMRDAPEMLDCITTVYSRDARVRSDDRFFTAWAVGLLARSFASAVAAGGSTTSTKQRILNMEESIFLRIIETTARLLVGDGTRDSLVFAVLEHPHGCQLRFSSLLGKDRATCWDQIVETLLTLSRASLSSR